MHLSVRRSTLVVQIFLAVTTDAELPGFQRIGVGRNELLWVRAVAANWTYVIQLFAEPSLYHE